MDDRRFEVLAVDYYQRHPYPTLWVIELSDFWKKKPFWAAPSGFILLLRRGEEKPKRMLEADEFFATVNNRTLTGGVDEFIHHTAGKIGSLGSKK